MRNKKPILQIDKFSGAGKNGILYCQGLYPETDNGKSVMGEGFVAGNKFNKLTTGFTNLGNIYGSLSLATIDYEEDVYNIYVNNNVYQGIYAHQEIGDEVKDGLIFTSPTSDYCYKPDLIETQLGNILFPSEKYIGRGVRFSATGGSTTTIIDTTKNFVALGYTSGDKVTNLKTGIIYTITSISTTTNTNDTLNFTASGTNTTGSTDECIAWEYDRFETNITKQAWQIRQTQWVKQFKQYDDRIFFTNGNYIGSISADESTVTKDFKQLPVKHQAIAISVNNSKVLVSSNYNGKGVLLLWDGSSDGWNNYVKFSVPISALIEYGSGWVFVSNGNVYYTDGYQVQNLYSLNQSKYLSSGINPASHNGMVIYEGMLYCCNVRDDYNLIDTGVYALNLNNVNDGFTLIKLWGIITLNGVNATRVSGIPYSIFLNNRWSDYQTIEVGCADIVNTINVGTYNGSNYDKSLIMSIPLDDQYKISGVGLNITRVLKDYNTDTTNVDTRDIQVSIGDGNRGLIGVTQTLSLPPTTTFIVNGEFYLNNEIGDEIYIYDKEDLTYSERTFITNITAKGETSETWTISPALSGPHKGACNLKMIRVNLLEKKTINNNQLKDEILFFKVNNSLFTNKLFLEIVIYSNANSFPLNINEINIYGE